MAATVIVLALLGIFVALLWMGYRDDRAHEERKRKHMDVWVRQPNPTDRAYSEWLNGADMQAITYVDLLLSADMTDTRTWPHEPPVGYDERKESA